MPQHGREEHEEALDEALNNLPNLLAKRRKLLDEREEELEKAFEKLEREKKTLGCGDDGDVIHLNVGGTLMATLRSTLTYVEDSMLAARFSGRWDESIAKDRDGNFFIDQPIEFFLPMIDYIRNKQNQTPSTGSPPSPILYSFENDTINYDNFKRMVEYFGVTLGIYPVELVDFTSKNKDDLQSPVRPQSLKLFSLSRRYVGSYRRNIPGELQDSRSRLAKPQTCRLAGLSPRLSQLRMSAIFLLR